MSALGILKAIALPALGAGIIAGLVAISGHVTPLRFDLTAFGSVVFFLGVVALCSLFPFHRDRDDDTETDADKYLEPLRQPGSAEKTLETDLRQRRMLLRPRGLTEARAAQLNRKVLRRTMKDRISRQAPQRGKHAAPVRPPQAARPQRRVIGSADTEVIPVVPAVPGSREVTEVIPVVPAPVPVALAAAAKPDTAFEDWHTGEFARDVWLMGISKPGGAA